MRWHLGLGLFLIGKVLLAQPIIFGNCDGLKAPHKQSLKTAMALEKGDMSMAKVYLQSAIRKQPESLHVKYLSAEFQLRNDRPRMALKIFEELVGACPTYAADLFFKIGALHAGAADLVKAKSAWHHFLHDPQVTSQATYTDTSNQQLRKEAQGWLDLYDFRDSLYANPVPFEPSLIPGLDSEGDEFLAVLSPDGKSWYYTLRQEVIDRKSGPAPIRRMKEVFTHAVADGLRASASVEMRSPFNRGFNEGGPTVTADNQWLALTSCVLMGNGYRNCDIMLVRRVHGAWDQLIPLSVVNGENSWESQPSLSANGDQLIYSSNREGGYGGLDLWMVRRLPNGNWSSPENLGPRINTAEDEKTPFLHADGQTLYFASNGHPGMGNSDVFVATIDGETKPTNMGYPINDDKANIGFAVSALEPNGYFSSNARGHYDIYRFNLPSMGRPNDVQFMRGQVEGVNQVEGLLQVRIENLESKAISRVSVDADGGYVAVVQRGIVPVDLVLTLDHPDVGYTSQRVHVSPDDSLIIAKSLEAKQLAKGATFDIRSIGFPSNSSKLQVVDIQALASFATYLIDRPSLVIELQGHTDNVGSSAVNRRLSQARADVVKKVLVDLGVDDQRIHAVGYGDSDAIAHNDNAAGRALNRRTSFQVLAQ
jgi:outer membrane protein OmpA-like peptidoglycan-associated protein